MEEMEPAVNSIFKTNIQAERVDIMQKCVD